MTFLRASVSMQKETALSRVRAAMQRNPLILIMCALSVCVQTTAAPTSAPIAGSFAYRCAKYQVDCATSMQLAALASGCFLPVTQLINFSSILCICNGHFGQMANKGVSS